MKSLVFALSVVIAAAALVTACSTKSTQSAAAPKFQEVEFTQAEVPYIQAVKKDGKLSAVIVTP